MPYSTLLPSLLSLVSEVSAEILPLYAGQHEGTLLSTKEDGSPLTQADILANTHIVEALQLLTPDIPIISEEACDIPFALRQSWSRFWLVDPIDGTKEFLAQNGDFTINIALIEYHAPVLGVVAIPVSGAVYYALKGSPAWKKVGSGEPQQITAATFKPDRQLQVVGSRRHGEAVIDKLRDHAPQAYFTRRGSSLKFCLVAEGQYDLYPRLGLTSEWDTAAGQCILEAAGGCVIDLQGAALRYGLRDSYQNPYFLAAGDPRIPWASFLEKV